jgi:GDPmannose 4,6-dehydratase
MLQQEQPVDYVIASGEQHTVRDFVNAAANELGMHINWHGEGVEEVGILEPCNLNLEPRPIVRVDPRYFRPTEVETLLGDATKAKRELGWEPKISFAELVAEMVRSDLEGAKRDDLCKTHGFNTFTYNE